jgi:hypothetical protein
MDIELQYLIEQGIDYKNSLYQKYEVQQQLIDTDKNNNNQNNETLSYDPYSKNFIYIEGKLQVQNDLNKVYYFIIIIIIFF